MVWTHYVLIQDIDDPNLVSLEVLVSEESCESLDEHLKEVLEEGDDMMDLSGCRVIHLRSSCHIGKKTISFSPEEEVGT